SGEGAGQPGTPDSPPENAPADGTGSDEGTIVPTGGGGSGPTAADQNTGGGLLDTISQGLKDVGTGIWDAGADFVTGIKDDAVGLWEGAKKLWNDPGQWFSDAKDSIVEGAKNTWNQVTTDPGGFFLDLLVSDEVQEDWKNGDKTHAVAQGIAENRIGLIPGVGWYKKGNRALNVMGGQDRGSETPPGPVGADGDQPGEHRRSDERTARPGAPAASPATTAAVTTKPPGPRRGRAGATASCRARSCCWPTARTPPSKPSPWGTTCGRSTRAPAPKAPAPSPTCTPATAPPPWWSS